ARARGALRALAARPPPHRPRMPRKRNPPRPRAKGLERTKYALLAALAGALWFTSCADFDIWPFAWIAMVPCLYAVEHASTTRRAVFYGWITGLVANAGGFYWITKLLTRFAHLPLALALFAYLLMSAYQGVVFALFAWVYRRIRERWKMPAALIAPLVMVSFELVVPMMFPCYLAITQAWKTHVIQIADLTGPLGVTAILLAVNGAIYEVVLARRWRPAVAAAGALILVVGYGELRLRQVGAAVAAAPEVTIGI